MAGKYCVGKNRLKLQHQAAFHLLGLVSQHVFQDVIGIQAGAVAGDHPFHAGVLEPLAELPDRMGGGLEEVEAADDGVDLLAGKGLHGLHEDGVGTGVAAAVEDHPHPLRCRQRHGHDGRAGAVRF